MGVILCHLAVVPSGSEGVEALTSAMAGNFSELEPEVTPAIGIWGGTTMVDDVEAHVRDALEETEVHAWGEEVASEITHNILAVGVSSSATSNC